MSVLSREVTATPSNKTESVNMQVVSPNSTTEIMVRLKHILGSGEKVTVTQVCEAILKLMVEDLNQLALNRISPLTIRAIVPRQPLSSALSEWAEARLSALIHQQSSIQLRECIHCKSQETHIEEDSLVFKRGNLASTRYSIHKAKNQLRSYLDLQIEWQSNQQSLVAVARLLSADHQILWTESYRSGDSGSLAKRGLHNLSQETSIKTYQRLAQSPRVKRLSIYEVIVGGGGRSGQGPFGFVARLGGGYGSFFGSNDRSMLMFQSILSFSGQRFFGDINAEYRQRLGKNTSEPSNSVNNRIKSSVQGLWLKGIFGVPFSPVISGLSLGAGLHFMTRYRLGLGITTAYAFNFNHRDERNPGGVNLDLNLITYF